MDFLFPWQKTRPFAHQSQVLEACKDEPAWALFLEQGLGKTKIVLDNASYLFQQDKIDGLLVVTPNEVLGNWSRQEVPEHCAAATRCVVHETRTKGTQRAAIAKAQLLAPRPDELCLLEISYDALGTDAGFGFASEFIKSKKAMIVLDESTMIKSPSAARTRHCLALGKLCPWKRILTGTPVSESAFDAYSQIKFLDPNFWKKHGLDNFSVFKAEFGQFEKSFGAGGRSFPMFKKYRNLDKLSKMIDSISSRLLKEDSGVELPPKIYMTRRFELEPAQRAAYDALKSSYVLELDGGLVEAPLALVRLMRLQQITSGHVTAEDAPTGPEQNIIKSDNIEDSSEWLDAAELVGLQETEHDVMLGKADYGKQLQAIIDMDAMAAARAMPKAQKLRHLVTPENNPRLQLLLGVLKEQRGKVIVWCRFVPDVDIVTEALGTSCLRYDGSVPSGMRKEILDRFRDPNDPARVLVANIHAISRGVTLTIAKTMVYYSNAFSLEKRLQSEDRNHRIGQDQSVTIFDLVANGTVDEKIVKALRDKFDVQALVLGDKYREWLS